MINAAFHKITNRANFTSLSLPILTTFQPTEETDHVARLRQLLKLDFKENDYYLIGLLSAFDSFPEIRAGIEETGRTYDFRYYQRPTTTIVGATLVPDRNGPGRIARIASDFPTNFLVRISYLSGTELKINDLTIPYHQRDNTLFPDWPPLSGLQGGLSLSALWAEDSVVLLSDIPRSYPYQAIATLLQNSSDAILTLQSQGLYASFFAAQTALEKVAITALALGLSNRVE